MTEKLHEFGYTFLFYSFLKAKRISLQKRQDQESSKRSHIAKFHPASLTCTLALVDLSMHKKTAY